MIWVCAPALAAAAYWFLVIVAALRWKPPAPLRDSPQPGISLLKPVRGRDPHFYEAIRSHALQKYPDYEILFGVADPDDPAIGDIRRLMAEFPDRAIRLIVASTRFPNAKVGVLNDLATQARYPLLLVNDSDIRVEAGYLALVSSVLQQPGVGLVTCLYGAESDTRPGTWEALGVATEFAPSVLVARMLGSAEFALGSTLLLRAEDLRRAGGFAAIGDYLADDYQLGLHIYRLGMKVAFAPLAVKTNLSGDSWGQVWRHQLRWSRSIRISRPGGYYGYAVTHATFWALVALAAGFWQAAAVALGLRLAGGVLVGWRALRDRSVAIRAWLIPFRDLWGFAIWVCGIFGRTVEWRGKHLKIAPDGRIITDL
ncbi:MAG: bacteriohopanetetrol glucosamine biosynthesis glycosyltransferase HpnI [Bryobacteraceae bacterium]